MTESLPPEDPRDALIREQAALIAGLSAQVTDLSAQIAELGELLDAAVGGRPSRAEGARAAGEARRRAEAR